MKRLLSTFALLLLSTTRPGAGRPRPSRRLPTRPGYAPGRRRCASPPTRSAPPSRTRCSTPAASTRARRGRSIPTRCSTSSATSARTAATAPCGWRTSTCKLSVLPEIGGRIFSAEDKTNGYPFFYRQRVIKPALIGMAGAWISGGVEWNVMHHHRATTFMPVQSAIVENADGSRTLWVGETEWRHRMRWVVGITLRPGRSAVETSVRMLNRTPLPHSVLYFANPAVHANEHYEVLFPPDVSGRPSTRRATSRRGRSPAGPSWASRTRRARTSASARTTLGRSPSSSTTRTWTSWAGSTRRQGAGVVHVADRDTVPGKKFWTWGDGPDGRWGPAS